MIKKCSYWKEIIFCDNLYYLSSFFFDCKIDKHKDNYLKNELLIILNKILNRKECLIKKGGIKSKIKYWSFYDKSESNISGAISHESCSNSSI